MADIVLTHATVATMNARREIIKDGAVAIESNRIVGVDKTEKIKPKYKADIELDCAGKLILPGLVDCHVHLAQALLRGCADDLSLVAWLRERVHPMQGTYSPKVGELSAKLCCIEMIKSGTTCFVESGLHWRYGFNEIAGVIDAVGIRAALSKKLMNLRGYADVPDAIVESMVEDGETTMRQTLEMIRKWHGKANNRIHIWFGARTPGGCTVEFYQKIAENARKNHTGITIHLGEVQQDIAYMRKEFKMTPMEFMRHCGVVGPHVIYAHGVWIPQKDFKILRETKGTVCHCPASNLKLASGFAPIPEMLKAGVNVSLGCDGGPSNNCYDMIREMKLAAIIHKARLLDPKVLPAEQVLEMATVNGARATLWCKELGSLEPGKLADLIVVDQRKPHLVPVRNPISNLVYAANGGDVDTVIIDGKIVMEGRELKTIDETEIVERAQEAGLEVDKRLGLKIGSDWPVK
ncbi:MAG: amidohydrolase [Candidatus Hodarchaeaceae archaeon]|nr:amidohydrolase [Candidatus Hodarchaeaceae archaeon]